MELGLQGKKVFISGSTSGIGLAVAKQFLEENAIVFINGRSGEKADRVLNDLRNRYKNRQIFSYVGDMRDEKCIVESRDVIYDKVQGLDILISNLGSGKPVADRRLDIKEWEQLFQVNLFSTVKLVDIYKGLLQGSAAANIVMISSIVACERMNAPVAYAAAKSGIRVLSNYLSGNFVEDHIRVNCVIPGNIYFEGGRWEELIKQDEEGVYSYINDNVPMKRFGTPEEVADAVVFLASERAKFINGAELVVDGGQKRS